MAVLVLAAFALVRWAERSGLTRIGEPETPVADDPVARVPGPNEVPPAADATVVPRGGDPTIGTSGLETSATLEPVADPDLISLRGRRLMLPVAGTRPDTLVPSFTQRRGVSRQHEALDIMAPRGTPVLAVEDGRIAKLFTSAQGGLTIYQFDPAEQFAYYYAHLDRYAAGITEGEPVARGQILGYVGSTGNAQPDAPHLHFAVFKLGPEKSWWEGQPLDPFYLWR